MAIFWVYLGVSLATLGSFAWYVRDESARELWKIDWRNNVPIEKEMDWLEMILEMVSMSFIPVAHIVTFVVIWHEYYLKHRKDGCDE